MFLVGLETVFSLNLNLKALAPEAAREQRIKEEQSNASVNMAERVQFVSEPSPRAHCW